MAVLLIATLDTKGEELGFVRDRLQAADLATIVVDVGTAGPPQIEPDIPRETIFNLAVRLDIKEPTKGDRGEAVAAMARGIATLAGILWDSGQINGVFALGGSAGTVIGTSAMRALPFGLPKVMVSTLASGQTRPFLEGSDIALFPAVADLAGLNRITRVVLENAAFALIGMAAARGVRSGITPARSDRPITVAATMFGVTTPCVDQARKLLDQLASRPIETLVFHATGTGGQAMESLIHAGEVDAVLDLTTTELADELVGGILSAGPDRLQAAVAAGLPQVVSVGALDMVNFGPRETVPERFAGRLFHEHNPSVTLMRTTPEECSRIGATIVAALQPTTAPTVVLLPLGGVSSLDVPGTAWHNPEANAALFDAIRRGLADHPTVEVIERSEHINDAGFAHEAARLLLTLVRPPVEPDAPSDPTETIA